MHLFTSIARQSSIIITIRTKHVTIYLNQITARFSTFIATANILTLFANKTRLVFYIWIDITTEHTFRTTTISHMQFCNTLIAFFLNITISIISYETIFNINFSAKIDFSFINSIEIIIHIDSGSFEIQIINTIIIISYALKRITLDITLISIISIFIIIINPAEITVFNERFKPIQDDIGQSNIFIGIIFHSGNNVLINDKQLTPLFIIPCATSLNFKRNRSIKIGNNNSRGIHHFNGSLPITTLIRPTHTRFPTKTIVTHSHIIHGVNRNMKIAFKHFLIKDQRMSNTKILISRKAICRSNLSDNFTGLTASSNMKILSIRHRQIKRISTILVCGQRISIN